MDDLIRRSEAIDGIIKSCFGQANIVQAEAAAIQYIKRIQSAQPLTAYVISDEDGNIKCSNCGSFECWGNYCMDCGAKMDGVKDDG